MNKKEYLDLLAKELDSIATNVGAGLVQMLICLIEGVCEIQLHLTVGEEEDGISQAVIHLGQMLLRHQQSGTDVGVAAGIAGVWSSLNFFL